MSLMTKVRPRLKSKSNKPSSKKSTKTVRDSSKISLSNEAKKKKRASRSTKIQMKEGDFSLPVRSTEDFQSLSFSILRLANRGLLTVDFLREVSKMLLDFIRCDAVEIWKRDTERCYRCSYSLLSHPSFHFESNACRCAIASTPLIPQSEKVVNPYETIYQTLLNGCSHFISYLPSLDIYHYIGNPASSLLLKPFAAATPKKSSKNLYHSILLVPFSIDDQHKGLLMLKSNIDDHFPPWEMKLYEFLAQTFGAAIASRRAQAALKERVKELTCLYSVSRLVEQPGISLDKLLQGIADLLPPAWQYPEVTSGRIELDKCSYVSPGSHKGAQHQSSEIIINGERRGLVEVRYRTNMPELHEGPFLAEERSLIDSIARQITLILERRQAEEERTRLQEQLRHADRLATIGTLAAGVAHELNEPLGGILGFAELSLSFPNLPQEVQKDIAKIIAASLHAREVVKKLMLFARQTPLRKIPVNLNQLVQEGLIFLETRCTEDKIELFKDLAPDLPEIIADPSLLQQVLVNLVVNAIQSMPEGGKLTIRTKSTRENVSLIVEDTGMGMSEEVQKRAFLPFFTTKDVGQGTGLGLSVVHGIVSTHGGSVMVDSREGSGSRFEVQLPLHPPSAIDEENMPL